MTAISKEEVIKIAFISNITLSESELNVVQNELQAVLSYAERVITIDSDAKDTQLVPLNVFRDDAVALTDSDLLLQGSPETSDRYFVVPLIIE